MSRTDKPGFFAMDRGRGRDFRLWENAMISKRVQPVVMTACLLALRAATSAEGFTLAENGGNPAMIVVARDATEAERHAAEELAVFLRYVTGTDFDAVAGPVSGTGRRILVGPGAAGTALADFPWGSLGQEEFIIRTVGTDLVLAGGRPRGTLYAVYTFLEDVVGCRWWTSGTTGIPSEPDLAVEELDIRYRPPLEFRQAYWYDTFDGDWAARNKMNSRFSARLDNRRGGGHVYEGFVHTFYLLIPPGEYYEEHPEWFSEIAGKRVHEYGQLCLTNDEMRAEFTENLKKRLRGNPEATIASVSQNDWHGNCQCARCAAIDAEEGSPAGSLLRFVNGVAEEIEEEFPHVAVSTLAYQYTRKPPGITRPRHNVIVRLCSIECSFSVPLTHERNRSFREDIEGWSKICDRLYVWDYTTNYQHYILPHPNLRVLGPNIRFFVDHGVRGVFEQGAYQSRGSEMAELKGWLLAKLLWNPALNADELVDEFLNGYYGAAAKYLHEYLDLIHDAVAESGDYLPFNAPNTSAFLSYETMRRGADLLAEAEAAVRENDEVLGRVHVAKLPILYTFLTRWQSFLEEASGSGSDWPVADSMQAVLDEFMQIAEAEGVTHVSEQKSLEQFRKETTDTIALESQKRPASPPPGCEDLPEDEWFDIQGDRFRHHRVGAWVTVQADPKASDGIASRLAGNHREWAIQIPLTFDIVRRLGSEGLRCRLSVRCELRGTEGEAFTCGIWDAEEQRAVAMIGVTASEIGGGEYRTYDLGVHDLDEQMYVWVAPAANEANVPGVCLDRVWLVR